MEFEPGQYVSVGVGGDINMREYSIYSPVDADYLEILVKEVEAGYVSRRCAGSSRATSSRSMARSGSSRSTRGRAHPPALSLHRDGNRNQPLSLLRRSYPTSTTDCSSRRARRGANATSTPPSTHTRLTTCLSRDPDAVDAAARSGEAIVAGRVTDYLREHPVPADTLCYLCGNCDMIYEAFDVLKGHGVPPEQLYAEVYF